MITTITSNGRKYRSKEFWQKIKKEFLENRRNGMKWRDNISEIAHKYEVAIKTVENQVVHITKDRKKTPPNLKKVNNCKISA